MRADMLRYQVSELIDNWINTKQKSAAYIARDADVYPGALSRMRNQHSCVSLDDICKVLDYMGYDIEIVKKEW